MLWLRRYAGTSLQGGGAGAAPVVVYMLLIAAASLAADGLQGLRASAVAAPRLQDTGSVVVVRGLTFYTWDISKPGIEPMSPVLAGEFFTNEPPGKPLHHSFKLGNQREG